MFKEIRASCSLGTMMPSLKKGLKNPNTKKQKNNAKIQRSFFENFDTRVLSFERLTPQFKKALEYDYPILIICNSDLELIKVTKFILKHKPELSFDIFSADFKSLDAKVLLISTENILQNTSIISHINFKLFLFVSNVLGEQSNTLRELIKAKNKW